MDIALDVEVRCHDGTCGRSTAIIVDPQTEQVTHFVVQVEGSEYLVPIAVITESTADHIQLRWNRQELLEAEPFEKQVPIDKDEATFLAAELAASTMTPYGPVPEYGVAAAMARTTLPVEQVPPRELAIHRGADVEATDGHIGQVEEFLVDSTTGQITHLVLRKGHLWGKRDVTIPLEQIARVEGDVVYLAVDKEAVGRLPGVPVRKK